MTNDEFIAWFDEQSKLPRGGALRRANNDERKRRMTVEAVAEEHRARGSEPRPDPLHAVLKAARGRYRLLQIERAAMAGMLRDTPDEGESKH